MASPLAVSFGTPAGSALDRHPAGRQLSISNNFSNRAGFNVSCLVHRWRAGTGPNPDKHHPDH